MEKIPIIKKTNKIFLESKGLEPLHLRIKNECLNHLTMTPHLY